VATGQNTLTFKGHEDFVTSVAMSRDGKLVVSGSVDKTARAWHTATGEEAPTLKRPRYIPSHSGISHLETGRPPSRRAPGGRRSFPDGRRSWPVKARRDFSLGTTRPSLALVGDTSGGDAAPARV